VVLGHAPLGVPGLPVEPATFSAWANRIGIAESDKPEIVEQQLCGGALAARALGRGTFRYTSSSMAAASAGRSRSATNAVVRDDCEYFQTVVAVERTEPSRSKRRIKNEKARPSSASSADAPRVHSAAVSVMPCATS